MNKTATYMLGAAAAVGLAISLSLSYWGYPKWIAIPKARQPILAFLQDPESAQFRNEQSGRAGAVCGEVNAKNSMGGYVGFKRYIWAGGGESYLEGEEPLNGWSAADVARRKEIEAKIFALFVDNRSESPGLQAPVGAELEGMATKHFFDFRWRELCGAGESVKS